MPELSNYKQERFCQTYAETMNILEAEKAGTYTKTYGYQLLEKPKVRDRIQEIQRGTADKMVVGQHRALREACFLAFSDITDTMGCSSPDDFKSLPEHVRKAISAVEITETPVRMGKDENGVQQLSVVRTIKIRMHAKSDPLRLVAQVTGLLDADNRDKEMLAFTGIEIVADLIKAREAKQLQHHPEGNDDDQT